MKIIRLKINMNDNKARLTVSFSSTPSPERRPLSPSLQENNLHEGKGGHDGGCYLDGTFSGKEDSPSPLTEEGPDSEIR